MNQSTGQNVCNPIETNPGFVLGFTFAYLLILVFGSVGNLSTCVVITCKHYMHSVTNYYLLNLAASDILLLLGGLPVDILLLWMPCIVPGGTAFCIIKALVTETATNASVLTIVAFTAERYFGICHPLPSNRLHRVLSLGVRRHILIIWSAATLSALPLAQQLSAVTYYTEPQGQRVQQCDIAAEREIPYSFEISSVVFFFLPMCVIITCYLLIIGALRKTLASELPRDCSPTLSTTMRRRDRVKARLLLIRMLVCISLAFFITFLPYHVQRILTAIVTRNPQLQTESMVNFALVLLPVSGILYYMAATLNPLIYNLLCRKFRIATKEILQCRRINGTGSTVLSIRFNSPRPSQTTMGGAVQKPLVKQVTAQSSCSVCNTINRKPGIETRIEIQDQPRSVSYSSLSSKPQLRVEFLGSQVRIENC